MSGWMQAALVGVAVIAAVGFLARHVRRVMRGEDHACGSCPGHDRARTPGTPQSLGTAPRRTSR